jgi:hypothetical protein
MDSTSLPPAGGVVSSSGYDQMNETSDAVNKRRFQVVQVSGSARKTWNLMSKSFRDAWVGIAVRSIHTERLGATYIPKPNTTFLSILNVLKVNRVHTPNHECQQSASESRVQKRPSEELTIQRRQQGGRKTTNATRFRTEQEGRE